MGTPGKPGGIRMFGGGIFIPGGMFCIFCTLRISCIFCTFGGIGMPGCIPGCIMFGGTFGTGRIFGGIGPPIPGPPGPPPSMASKVFPSRPLFEFPLLIAIPAICARRSFSMSLSTLPCSIGFLRA